MIHVHAIRVLIRKQMMSTSAACISKIKQDIKNHKTVILQYDTNVEITKTTQENQNTEANLQHMQADIQKRQNGGQLKVCKLQ